jgi:hypothetical protein
MGFQGEIAWFNLIDVLIDEGRVYNCPKWREKAISKASSCL